MIGRVKVGLHKRQANGISQDALDKLAGGCFVFKVWVSSTREHKSYIISDDSPSPILSAHDLGWVWNESLLDVIQDEGVSLALD